VRTQGCRFFVGGRQHSEAGFRCLEQLPIPPEVAALFLSLSESEFRVDLSSTQLRERTANQART
jgi:hypothetical protein